MRIIGSTENNGLLISATRTEIANLVGYFYEHTAGCPALKPGVEIPVSKMYSQLYELARKKKTLASTAATIRQLADLLELQSPIIESSLDISDEVGKEVQP